MPPLPRVRALVGAVVSATVLGVGGAPYVLPPARNYLDPGGPRYVGLHAIRDLAPGRLVVATFNVRFAREIDRAIELVRGHEHLRDADVLALQEMDAPGCERMARALGYSYVYYPGAVHAQGGKDFGTAVLFRGTLLADRKLMLPHLSRFRRMQRAVAVATLDVGGRALRVYSVHLEAPLDISPSGRRDQVAAIVADARGAREPVVVTGDFNSRDLVGQALAAEGFAWLTEKNGGTIRMFSWDHVFARGLRLAREDATGVVLDNNGASDHLPVWAELVWE